MDRSAKTRTFALIELLVVITIKESHDDEGRWRANEMICRGRAHHSGVTWIVTHA